MEDPRSILAAVTQEDLFLSLRMKTHLQKNKKATIISPLPPYQFDPLLRSIWILNNCKSNTCILCARRKTNCAVNGSCPYRPCVVHKPEERANKNGDGHPMGRPTFNKFIVIRKGPTHCFRAILEWIINKKAHCFVQPHDTKRVQVGFADSFFWVQPVATFLFFNLARVRQSSDSEWGPAKPPPPKPKKLAWQHGEARSHTYFQWKEEIYEVKGFAVQ